MVCGGFQIGCEPRGYSCGTHHLALERQARRVGPDSLPHLRRRPQLGRSQDWQTLENMSFPRRTESTTSLRSALRSTHVLGLDEIPILQTFWLSRLQLSCRPRPSSECSRWPYPGQCDGALREMRLSARLSSSWRHTLTSTTDNRRLRRTLHPHHPKDKEWCFISRTPSRSSECVIGRISRNMQDTHHRSVPFDDFVGERPAGRRRLEYTERPSSSMRPMDSEGDEDLQRPCLPAHCGRQRRGISYQGHFGKGASLDKGFEAVVSVAEEKESCALHDPELQQCMLDEKPGEMLLAGMQKGIVLMMHFVVADDFLASSVMNGELHGALDTTWATSRKGREVRGKLCGRGCLEHVCGRLGQVHRFNAGLTRLGAYHRGEHADGTCGLLHRHQDGLLTHA